MSPKAEGFGAAAIVGVEMDYETLRTDNGMIMVTYSGTAVKLKNLI